MSVRRPEILSFFAHAAVLLHRAFLVGIYGQMDTSPQISEALKVLHMEAIVRENRE
ncbi:hypothetical protein AB205_0191080 [Aquarana catesbeiana]|uniref:Uncharacterized protein n=1 Tax=Aquarana catesbeiana TaxID=8400 RepID=A0A2G9SCH4_AQUCT|nr:hypothetical protein AB205_0191080 [Aquarana catesbeiana]